MRLNVNVIPMSKEELLKIEGGNKIVDVVNAACAAYATYAVIALTAGVTAIAIGSAGAFCAGWKVADLFF
jgi:hypothetical protein